MKKKVVYAVVSLLLNSQLLVHLIWCALISHPTLPMYQDDAVYLVIPQPIAAKNNIVPKMVTVLKYVVITVFATT